jgi:hypothetical protein
LSIDVDEWHDDQRQQQRPIDDSQNQWSIEKILYPDWLYKGSVTSPPIKKTLNTSTLLDVNGYVPFETHAGLTNSNHGRRTMSSSLTSNVQPSPKQVRFGCQEQLGEQARSHPHLSTTLKQLRSGTMTTILKTDAHDTFI